MVRRTRTILGKRGRRNMLPEQIDTEERRTVPKRLRTRAEHREARQASRGPLTTRPRNGLLTPEPSSLTESQVAPPVDSAVPGQTFPLSKLPAELRIHIYHMALSRDEPLLLHVDRAPKKSEKPETPDEEVGVFTFRARTIETQPVHFGPLPHFARAPSSEPSSEPSPAASPAPKRTPLKDPIVPEILRLNKLIYKEARQVLYSDNVFILSLTSGAHVLGALHQRTRSLIKSVILTINSHHDVLDGFADIVRCGLRYCWGLKSFKIILQASLPDNGGRVGATNVYGNAFHILRWLPKGCVVELEGCVSESILEIVREEAHCQAVLSETNYLKRQHQMPERH